MGFSLTNIIILSFNDNKGIPGATFIDGEKRHLQISLQQSPPEQSTEQPGRVPVTEHRTSRQHEHGECEDEYCVVVRVTPLRVTWSTVAAPSWSPLLVCYPTKVRNCGVFKYFATLDEENCEPSSDYFNEPQLLNFTRLRKALNLPQLRSTPRPHSGNNDSQS